MPVEKNESVEKLCVSLRCTLGCLLILSAILKFASIASFTHEIQLFVDLYLLDFLHEWSSAIAVTVSVSELIIGTLALTGKYIMAVSVMLVVMFSFFLYLTGLNAFFPPEFFGSIESCGCFGELIHFTPMASFYKSFVLWGMAVILLTIMIKKNGWVLFRNKRNRL